MQHHVAIGLLFPFSFLASPPLPDFLSHSPCQALHPGLEGAVADDDPREASPDVPRRTCGTKEKEIEGGCISHQTGNYIRQLSQISLLIKQVA